MPELARPCPPRGAPIATPLRAAASLLTASLLFGACAPADEAGDATEQPAATGEATDVSLLDTSVDDAAAYLDGLEGPVVVNVWASWCPPCRDEAPLLAAAARRFEGEVTFVGVDFEDSEAGALRFIETFDIPFTSLYDPDGEMARQLGLRGIPVTVVFDASGDEVLHKVGSITEPELLAAIDEARRR